MAHHKKAGNVASVLEIMNLLLFKDFMPYPDAITFNIVIDAIGKQGLLDEMENYFFLMFDMGSKPNIRTFCTTFNCCILHYDTQRLPYFIYLMNAMGIQWNRWTIDTMSKALVPYSR